MASVIHLDTHSAIWLHDGDIGRFHPSVLPLLRSAPLMLSPMVVLEFHYLHEIGRLVTTPATLVANLEQRLSVTISDAPFRKIVAEAVKLTWTRDPFDRLICATARAAGATLLSKDADIRANEPTAFWDQPPPHEL